MKIITIYTDSVNTISLPEYFLRYCKKNKIKNRSKFIRQILEFFEINCQYKEFLNFGSKVRFAIGFYFNIVLNSKIEYDNLVHKIQENEKEIIIDGKVYKYKGLA